VFFVLKRVDLNEHDLKNALMEVDRAAALAPFSVEYQQLAAMLLAVLSK